MLSELVSFKSVKAAPAGNQPFGEEIHKAFSYMLARAKQDGFEVFDADGYGGHIEWPGVITDEKGEIISAAEETLGVAVHLDVVPAGDGWTYDPWGGEVFDGRMYGRGTTDNKGAAASVYFAMKALKEAGYTPAKNIRLIIGLDEETGWSGMEKYFEKASAPDFGFTPDSEFPVINGEMGILVFEIAKKLEANHENGLILRSIAGGNAPNMTPDHCRAILVFEGAGSKAGKPRRKSKAKAAGKEVALRNKAFTLVKETAIDYSKHSSGKLSCKGAGNSLEVHAQGLSAHGAQPWKGMNAISILIDFLCTLPIANESAKDFIDFYKTHIGFETDGKNLGIAMSDETSGPLIVNIGKISLGREAAVLTVNARYPISVKEDEVYEALRPALDKNGLGVAKKSCMAPLFYPPEEPFIQTLMEVYRNNTGDAHSKSRIIGGGTYARAFRRTVAFGPRFPHEEDIAHQKDEYILLDSLMDAAQIYADAIYRLSG